MLWSRCFHEYCGWVMNFCTELAIELKDVQIVCGGGVGHIARIQN